MGGAAIKMKIETTIRMQEIPDSMGNAITLKKRPQGCWFLTKKGKHKYNDVENLFMGATLFGEFQEEKNEEYLE